MFYGDSVSDTRQMFYSAWEKYQNNHPMSALERQIAEVIAAHPEYHKVMQQNAQFIEHTYYPELGDTNPFLHMGLHLAVREQVATDRPAGIHAAYHRLLMKYKDPLQAEHLIMDQLAECLWHAQKNNQPPDEEQYINSLLDR